MKKVYIFDRLLLQYRKEFFNGLKLELGERNIELNLLYGKSNSVLSKKKDEIDLDWANYRPYKTLNLGKFEFIWQPYLNEIKKADLIIIENANRLLINYLLILLRPLYKAKLAFWGHVINMQKDNKSLGNKFKNMFSTRSDWWFTYTESGKQELESQLYHSSNITVVQNAIDTKSLASIYDEISNEQIESLKESLKIQSENIGIYCGGMYAEKRLEFLIEACKRIRSEIEDFTMLFIGGGEDANIVEKATKEFSWIRYLGPKFGKKKIELFKLANIQLMPGLVGLGILDSFALETPIITTKYPFHSPEIDYLVHDYNGLISENDLTDFSIMTIKAFKEKSYNKLRKGCQESSKIYTVEKMIRNFADGVESCLSK